MFVIVAYDISDDRRRLRLYKTLKRFGSPVQRSVIECWLAPTEVIELKQAVFRVIDEKTDQVRFYYLCESCQPRLEATSSSRMTSDPQVVIV